VPGRAQSRPAEHGAEPVAATLLVAETPRAAPPLSGALSSRYISPHAAVGAFTKQINRNDPMQIRQAVGRARMLWAKNNYLTRSGQKNQLNFLSKSINRTNPLKRPPLAPAISALFGAVFGRKFLFLPTI